MVGGRVGFYELEKSDFVLFKAHFTLNKAHILQYNCRLYAFRALKKRKLTVTFLAICTQQNLNEHLLFQPTSFLRRRKDFQHRRGSVFFEVRFS